MNEMPNSLLATDESAPVTSAGHYGLYEKNGEFADRKTFRSSSASCHNITLQ